MHGFIPFHENTVIRFASRNSLATITVVLMIVAGAIVFGNLLVSQIQFSAHIFSAPALAAEQGEVEVKKTEPSAKINNKKTMGKWTCPMHPHFIADEFGSCPICGMDLVKLETPGQAQGETKPQSRSGVIIAPETIQNMGVRIAKAEKSNFGRIIRSYGRVAENERLQSELTARLEGWIEDLRIRSVGDQVKKGDLLFTLYAPEFIVSQRDLIAARKGRNRSRIDSIKTRLRAFGMQDQVIKDLVRKDSVHEFVPFYATLDGTVAMIDLRPGSYVKRGTMLTRIQDYSQVWLMVSISEKDLSFIKTGTPARITFPNIPGREVFARVEYVYPTVDARTRTGQIRLVLDNPDGQLRPGAYADVAFDVETQQRLAVPTEAILKSGSGRYVIASLDKGRFEPRSVKIGITSGRWTEISGEIEQGDDIVVSGQFMIDSESALRESFQKLERLRLPLSLLKLDKTQFAMIDHMVDAALYIHEALTDGNDIDPKQLDPALEIKTFLWPAFQHTRLSSVMTEATKALKKAKKAQAASETKSALSDLVNALQPWLFEGDPQHYKERKVSVFQDHQSGRKWLQMEAVPANPYGSGKSMNLKWPDAKKQATTSKSSSQTPVSTPTPRGSSHVGH